MGERNRAYSLARGPCLLSQCFSKACGFTTCPQWLHTTRKKSSWPGYRPKMDMSGDKETGGQRCHNGYTDDSRSQPAVGATSRGSVRRALHTHVGTQSGGEHSSSETSRDFVVANGIMLQHARKGGSQACRIRFLPFLNTKEETLPHRHVWGRLNKPSNMSVSITLADNQNTLWDEKVKHR